MVPEHGERETEGGVRTDPRPSTDDAGRLALDEPLGVQRPPSRPEHPDELLIVQHQTTEPWFLVLHELRAVRGCLDADDVGRAEGSGRAARPPGVAHRPRRTADPAPAQGAGPGVPEPYAVRTGVSATHQREDHRG